MNKNIYILPVSATFRNIRYPEPLIATAEELEQRLKEKYSSFKLGKKIKGNAAAGVFEALLDKKKVIVKHTENVEPASPIEFLIMNDAHDAEIRVLKRLSSDQHIRVPQIIDNFPKITTSILEDMRQLGYANLSKLILRKKINMKSAKHIGCSLAYLAQSSREWEEFKTNESAQLSFYERSLGMLVAYPHDTKRYKRLEAQFTQYSPEKEEQLQKPRFFVWPDSHPKNMLVNKNGDATFIDFGRCHWGDQRYMLPHFLAHIVLYSLTKHISKSKMLKYIEACIKAYKEIEPIENEALLAQYLAMELLHRANGKHIEGITKSQHKISIQRLGLTIFDSKVKTIRRLMQLIKKAK